MSLDRWSIIIFSIYQLIVIVSISISSKKSFESSEVIKQTNIERDLRITWQRNTEFLFLQPIKIGNERSPKSKGTAQFSTKLRVTSAKGETGNLVGKRTAASHLRRQLFTAKQWQFRFFLFFFFCFSTAAFFLPKARRNYRWLIPINDVVPMCFSRTAVPTLAVGTCDRIVDPLHGLPWPLSAHRCRNIVEYSARVGGFRLRGTLLWDY